MSKSIVQALIWREFIEGKKHFLIMLYYIPVLLFINFFTLFELFKNIELMDNNETANITLDALKSFYAVNQMFFIAPMMIPLISVIFLSRLASERSEKSISVLMAIQIKPQLIWATKTFTANCFSGISYLISCVIYFLVIKFGFGVTMVFTIDNVVGVFFVSPIIGLTISVILALLYWVIKNPGILSILVSVFSVSGVWFLSMRLQNMNMSIELSLLILAVSCIVFLICLKIIALIPNEYIANL